VTQLSVQPRERTYCQNDTPLKRHTTMERELTHKVHFGNAGTKKRPGTAWVLKLVRTQEIGNASASRRGSYLT
jgi:hypothetical protein